jgi:hypothetical protein
MGGERSPISKYTVGAVASVGPGLVRLHLIGFEKITDQSFAAVISKHHSLEDLSLRYQSSLNFVRESSLGVYSGCTLVGPKTVQAAAEKCPSLTSVNFNYTSVTPLSLVPLLRKCGESLEVLKVAGINSWVHFRLSSSHRAPSDRLYRPTPQRRSCTLNY